MTNNVYRASIYIRKEIFRTNCLRSNVEELLRNNIDLLYVKVPTHWPSFVAGWWPSLPESRSQQQ